MTSEKFSRKILTLPLPELFDELEDQVEEIRQLIKESREAIMETKAVAKASEAAMAKMRGEIGQSLDKQIAEMQSQLANFENLMKQEALAVDAALLAAKDKHVELSSFLEKT